MLPKPLFFKYNVFINEAKLYFMWHVNINKKFLKQKTKDLKVLLKVFQVKEDKKQAKTMNICKTTDKTLVKLAIHGAEDRNDAILINPLASALPSNALHQLHIVYCDVIPSQLIVAADDVISERDDLQLVKVSV